MDTHQWNQDEDYSEGRTPLVRTSSNKSHQQHQPHRGSYQSSKMSLIGTSSDKSHKQYQPPPESYQSSDNHLQQQQAPAMVASPEGYPSKGDDDDSLNDQSFETLQKSDQDHPSNSQKSIFHPKQQQQPSIGATSLEGFAQKDESYVSFCQPQQWQTSVTVPPERHPSKDVHPSVHQSSHSPTPMTAHSHKAPSARDPPKNPNHILNYNPPRPDPEEHRIAYPEKTAGLKAEITPAYPDSTETSPKNVGVRRSTTKAPSSFCSGCSIS